MVELTSLHTKITGDARGLIASTNQALAGFAKVHASTKRAQTATERATAATTTQMAAFRRVANTTKLAAAAATKHSAALKTLSTAATTGAAAQKGLTAAVASSKGSFAVAGASVDTFATQIRTSRFHTANLAAQFNDIGVMLASGQSPLILAVQQGTQITQVLQTMGGTAKQQLGALKTAFLAIISPTALVVIALIAGGVALARWAFNATGATSDTDQLTDAIESLDSITSDAKGALDTLTLDAEELAEKFGDAAQEARNLARDIARLTVAELAQKMRKDFTLLGDQLGGFFGNTLSLKLQKAIVAGARRPKTDELKREFVSTVNPIFESLALQTLTFDEQKNAVRTLIQTYTDFKVSMEDLPGPVIEAAKQLLNLTSASLEAQQALNLALAISPSADPPLSTATINEAERAAQEKERLQEANKRAEEQILLELERINDFNATKLELEAQFHRDRLAVIEEARAKELITQEEANRFAEEENRRHQLRLAAIDQAVNAIRIGAAGDFFGQLANVFEQGSERMLKIAKIFGAAQALINAWGAFAKVLNDPTLLWWQRIPAALGVLAAGLGAVNAIKGVGKGGSGATSTAAAGASTNAGQVAAAPATSTTAVNISLRGQVFDRGAVIGLIEQINDAIGDGARIRAT